MGKTSRRVLGYERKKRVAGYLFLIPWIIGTVSFFLLPLIDSALYSIGELRIGEHYGIDIIGLGHYIRAFTEDSTFLPLLTGSIPPFLYQIPILVLLSLFLALLLNGRFFGRTAVRGVFFLPIIIANGIILSILNGDAFSNTIMAEASVSRMFDSEMLGLLLREMNGGEQVLGLVTGYVNSVFDLLWKSGIQTLLFITALQSIPVSMYEAARMEGGTAWETFWKITFPMVSPTILLNLIYTIIDTFGDYGNRIVRYIYDYTIQGDFNYSAALTWIYTVIMLALVGVCYLIVNRFVYYEV